jgi:hypothetical protein
MLYNSDESKFNIDIFNKASLPFKELIHFAIDKNFSKRENLCKIKIPKQFSSLDPDA